MSIETALQYLHNAKDAIRSSIMSCGVNVPQAARIDTYYNYINQINSDIPLPANCSAITLNDYGQPATVTWTHEGVGPIAGQFRSLTSVSLPNAVNMETEEFYSCVNLISVSMPSLIETGDSAFSKCSNLSSVYIPNVKKIIFNTFRACSSLTSIDLPSVEEIKDQAFEECTGLTSIDLPNTVKSIGWQAFGSCSSLASFTCRATTPPTLDTDVFYNTSSSLVIYVPAESVDAYKNATRWSTYADKIQAIP